MANELDLHFLTLKKCTKGQFIRLILSKDKQTYICTDSQMKHMSKFNFRVQGISKREDLLEAGGVQILHKSNIFSDENVKAFVFIRNTFFICRQKMCWRIFLRKLMGKILIDLYRKSIFNF